MRVTRKLKTCKVSLRSGTLIRDNYLSNENDRIIQYTFIKTRNMFSYTIEIDE